jgi:cytoskeletal protein RodZ
MKKTKQQKKKQPQKKKKRLSWEVWFLLIFAAAIGIGVLWTEKYIYAESTTAKAVITDIRQMYRGRCGFVWNVEYRYTVDGKTYTNDDDFSTSPTTATIKLEIPSQLKSAKRIPKPADI